MRVGIATFLRERAGGAALERLVALGTAVEKAGLGGLWVSDAMGRGVPTLDPLIALAALCPVTERIELGTGVLQVSLRPAAVELAHRIQSLQVLSRGRLRLGVGAGSTWTDFALVGADYESRFKTLRAALGTMRAVWRGEAQAGRTLSPWQEAAGGPPVIMGAWRSPRWITYAAEECQGWIASALYGRWREITAGIAAYRAAGGKRAILTNLPFDLGPVDLGSGPRHTVEHAREAEISLVAPPPQARETWKRIAHLGFDDVVLLPPDDEPQHLEMIAELTRTGV